MLICSEHVNSVVHVNMDTCVLIPQELSLVMKGQKGQDGEVTVHSNTKLPQGFRIIPFQGTLRCDKLPVFSYLDDTDVRHRFGLYDEIAVIENTKIRHCNWVRFLRVSPNFSSSVNLIGTKYKGEPIYEVVHPIEQNTELRVYYLPERPEDLLMPAFHYLKASLFRRTVGSILEESPLDLSTKLLSNKDSSSSVHSSDSEERKSVSSDEATSVSSLTDADLTGKPPVLSPPPFSLPPGGPLSLESLPRSHPPTESPQPRKHRERSMLPCQVCGKTFDRPSLLKRHMRTHTGEKPHVCDVCNKGFSTSSSLNTHRRIHSGEKPHQCQVCGKRFTASSNLYYHRMTHIKEKPHKCTLCSKSFPTPGDLKSHMYVHNGSWPYKCHICNRGFSKHTNLKNHLFLHTGDKPHVCELCDKKFALACNLRAHLKTHGEPREECVRCGGSFTPQSKEFLRGVCSSCVTDVSLPALKIPNNPLSLLGPNSPLN